MAEIVGLAASIIQIAGAGAALSTALYNFVGSAVRADQEIADIASDVQVTSNALESVGRVFKNEDAQSIVSKKAILDANNLIKRCENVFKDIELLLHKRQKVGKDGKKTSGVMGKLAWPLKEHRVELHRQRLESLKNSLMVLLHVLQLAQGQARGQFDQSALIAEREKIRELHTRQQDSIRILNLLESKFSNITVSDAGPSVSSIASFAVQPATLGSTHEDGKLDVLTIDLNTADDSEVSDSDSIVTDEDEGHVSVEELAKCAQHVQKLLKRITQLQRKSESSGLNKGHRAKHVHKLYTRFRGRWESEIRAPPAALALSAGQAEETTPAPEPKNSKTNTMDATKALDQNVAATVRALRIWMKPPKHIEERLEGVSLDRQLHILIAALISSKRNSPAVGSSPVQRSNNPILPQAAALTTRAELLAAQAAQAAQAQPQTLVPAQAATGLLAQRAAQQLNAQSLLNAPQSNTSVSVMEQKLRTDAVRYTALYIQKNGYPKGTNELAYQQSLVRSMYAKLRQQQAEPKADQNPPSHAPKPSMPGEDQAGPSSQQPQLSQASPQSLGMISGNTTDKSLDQVDVSDAIRKINGLPMLPSSSQPSKGNNALQDYQTELMLLELQNKQRLMKARQAQSMELPQSQSLKRAYVPNSLDIAAGFANSSKMVARKKQKSSVTLPRESAENHARPSHSGPLAPVPLSPPVRIKSERTEVDSSISSTPDLPQLDEYTSARLETWFDAHSDDPYPDEETLDALALECDIARSTIEEWLEVRRQQAQQNTLPEILKMEDIYGLGRGNVLGQKNASVELKRFRSDSSLTIEGEHGKKRQRTHSSADEEQQLPSTSSTRSHDEEDIVDVLLGQWTVSREI